MTSLANRATTIRAKIERAQLRATKQRVMLGALLFGGPDRHVSAEALHREAQAAGVAVSLATVYNTLHAFTGAGLLRQLAVDGASALFDTNTAPHHHFIDQDTLVVTDVPDEAVEWARLPEPPHGVEIERVEVTIRVRARRQTANTGVAVDED